MSSNRTDAFMSDQKRREQLLECAHNLQGIAELMRATTGDGEESLNASAVNGMAALLDSFAENLVRVNKELDSKQCQPQEIAHCRRVCR